ncbi:MAG: glycosyltransferase family 4 protein [Lentisphaeria bacterium]|nr:glycosyltransferase family 4 protein [Lentisphaeria bacterium]MDP7741813.1 glycosyltransferase family 4 protein [Lentisphaeria bacterium]
MKILLIITELGEGGAENALGQVASGLSRRGHQVRVACLFNSDGAVARRLNAAGIEVDSLGVTGTAKLPAGLKRLRAVIRDFVPDIVHSWLFHANFLARLALPRGLPLIASLRVVEPRKSHVWLEALTHGRVSHCICVSNAVQEFAVEQVGMDAARCTTIGNGVDFEAFAAARAANRGSATMQGLCVARLTHQKGLDILLEALAGLPADIDWHWRFVGAEPEPVCAAQLRQAAAHLGIAARLDWCGPVPREQLVDYYAAANLLALPSRWEGQANVVLEALAAGVPVLASETDGIRDLTAAAPAALTVVADNVAAAWTAALNDLWRAPDRRAAQVEAGVAFTSDRAWATVVDRHLEVYRDVSGA